MKNNLKRIIQSVLFVCSAMFVVGCDLEKQEDFDFKPETAPIVTFGSMTPLEWIMTNPGGEFDYLIKAIELTGSEDLFSKDLANKTFFLLKDEAFRVDDTRVFRNKNEMMSLEFKIKHPAANKPAQDPAELNTLTAAQLSSLKDLLAYHVITTYVDQGPEHLYVMDKDYQFATVFQGPNNNVMSLRRNRNFGIEFNRDATLPSSRKGGSVNRHNYIFANGTCVAHLMTEYTKISPFWIP